MSEPILRVAVGVVALLLLVGMLPRWRWKRWCARPLAFALASAALSLVAIGAYLLTLSPLPHLAPEAWKTFIDPVDRALETTGIEDSVANAIAGLIVLAHAALIFHLMSIDRALRQQRGDQRRLHERFEGLVGRLELLEGRAAQQEESESAATQQPRVAVAPIRRDVGVPMSLADLVPSDAVENPSSSDVTIHDIRMRNAKKLPAIDLARTSRESLL